MPRLLKRCRSGRNWRLPDAEIVALVPHEVIEAVEHFVEVRHYLLVIAAWCRTHGHWITLPDEWRRYQG